MKIGMEFLRQIILVIFYLAIIVVGVKLGIYLRKKKNLKEEANQKVME